jgi:hypothetical protein
VLAPPSPLLDSSIAPLGFSASPAAQLYQVHGDGASGSQLTIPLSCFVPLQLSSWSRAVVERRLCESELRR